MHFHVGTFQHFDVDIYNWKGVDILEAEVCIDHVHMLIEIPPKMNVSNFVGLLKGKAV
jgi:putative transposase